RRRADQAPDVRGRGVLSGGQGAQHRGRPARITRRTSLSEEAARGFTDDGRRGRGLGGQAQGAPRATRPASQGRGGPAVPNGPEALVERGAGRSRPADSRGPAAPAARGCAARERARADFRSNAAEVVAALDRADWLLHAPIGPVFGAAVSQAARAPRHRARPKTARRASTAAPNARPRYENRPRAISDRWPETFPRAPGPAVLPRGAVILPAEF